MVRLSNTDSLCFPKSAEELMNHFHINESENGSVFPQVLGMFKALRESKSILVGSGLIKEKSPALKFFSENIQEIAQLIILWEIESGRITRRSSIAKRYLEVENHESNLYLFMLEIEEEFNESL